MSTPRIQVQQMIDTPICTLSIQIITNAKKLRKGTYSKTS